jgi:hypothetical protein
LLGSPVASWVDYQYSITRRKKYDLQMLCYVIGGTGINTGNTDTPSTLQTRGLEANINRVTVFAKT